MENSYGLPLQFDPLPRPLGTEHHLLPFRWGSARHCGARPIPTGMRLELRGAAKA